MAEGNPDIGLLTQHILCGFSQAFWTNKVIVLIFDKKQIVTLSKASIRDKGTAITSQNLAAEKSNLWRKKWKEEIEHSLKVK